MQISFICILAEITILAIFVIRYWQKVPKSAKFEDLPKKIDIKVRTEHIKYLSKEIETHTKVMMDFRNKASFTVFIGPYIVLGSYLVSRKTDAPLPRIGLSDAMIELGIILFLFYLGIGCCAYCIEFHIWDKCNVWRRMIRHIGGGVIPEKECEFGYENKKALGAYLLPYAFMGLSFLIIMYLIMGSNFQNAFASLLDKWMAIIRLWAGI
jgi:hypothetical protein